MEPKKQGHDFRILIILYSRLKIDISPTELASALPDSDNLVEQIKKQRQRHDHKMRTTKVQRSKKTQIQDEKRQRNKIIREQIKQRNKDTNNKDTKKKDTRNHRDRKIER